MGDCKICNTCKHKVGKVFIMPISKKQMPIFSCKNYELAEGYCYEKNTCSNYDKEILNCGRNMRDLISRVELKNHRPEYLNEKMDNTEKANYNKGWNACNTFWLNILKEQPTAYNVAWVLEQLEKNMQIAKEHYEYLKDEDIAGNYEGKYKALCETIGIVEAGGIDD